MTPWSVLTAEVEPFSPQGEGGGRPPIGRERMLRRSIAPPCVGLSEEGVEEAIDDRYAIRGLVDMDLAPEAREAAPYAATLLKWRHLREAHPLTERRFAALFHRYPRARGRQGVDVPGRDGEQGNAPCRARCDDASKHRERPREA